MAGVSIGTGFAANVGSDALSGLWNNFVQVLKLIRGLPTAVRDMNDKVQRLKDVRDEINEVLAREQRNAKAIVQNWLNKVDRAIQSSESINNDCEQPKICLGCCPNYRWRYRISKDIRALNLTVDRLHSEKVSDFPSGEYGDPTPPSQIPTQHPEFVGTGIENAQSKLESWLTEDNNIRVIGVCGMGGVGKTSLLQTINNSHKVGQSFTPIIWLTFSRDYDILHLQDCMASKLGLNLPHISNFEGRKHMLFTRLRNQKFLLILDDMWRNEDLESLGVPLNDTASKIVLSTRSQVVCRQMKVDQILRVEPLSKEEGWQMFCKRAFQSGNVPQELKGVAKKIAGESKGLPLAIKVVAAGMANYSDEREWEDALHQMQNLDEAFYAIHDEIEKELFQRLKWSYNALPEYLKTCFLYFAAYPEDSDISCKEVIDIWIAEGLVKGNQESYLPDTALTSINSLGDRCLIEVTERGTSRRILSVKMHDILRDLAIRIAETEHRSYFKAGQRVSHFPLEEVDGKGCTQLSLMHTRLDSLPTAFACSSLSVLLLRQNPLIKEVSGSFLGELSALKVLDLSETGITSLPTSIGNLKHLVSLQLQVTEICELPKTIGHLTSLQFLNVSYCHQLRCLQERISELKRLRALDISYCESLNHLPRGISELVSLERLEMFGSHFSMDFEEDANVERESACLKDLQSLCGLRELSVEMRSPIKEGVLGNWSKMRALTLSFDGHVDQDYLPQDMQAMKDLEYFRLWRGSNVERLPSWVSELQGLCCLDLQSCKQLRELDLGTGFPKLHTLILHGLESLECVSIVAAASGSGGLGEGVSALPMLKSLHIYKCKKLKTLGGRCDKLECLEHLYGEQEWWDAMQCNGRIPTSSRHSKANLQRRTILQSRTADCIVRRGGC